MFFAPGLVAGLSRRVANREKENKQQTKEAVF